MTNNPLQVDTSDSPKPQKKRRGWMFWIIGLFVSMCLMSVCAFGLKPFLRHYFPREERVQEIAVLKQSSVGVVHDTDIAVDESELLWASPNSGPPITLEYVPLGTQAILQLRPAESLAHPEGEKLLGALGPWGIKGVKLIEQATGAKLAEMETLLVAFHREDDQWQFALRATLVEPWSTNELHRATASQSDSQRAVFLPEAGQGRVLVSCHRGSLAELTEQGKNPAILPRDVERLLIHSDTDRTATLLMPARFLETAGRELLLDGGEKLTSAFDTLLPDNAGAIAISLDCHEQFFCEVAATIVQNEPPHRFAAEFAERLNSAEEQVAASLESNPPRAYGKAVEERFPAMLKAMSDYTRTSYKDGVALARCYLPIHAGHNLLLATRLSLESRRSDRLNSELAAPKAESGVSLSDKLNQVTSLSFPKETLDKALEMLADDLQVPIQIAGRDLQLEGITKNQTLSLDLQNRPAGEILVEVLQLANPDREAAGAADTRQKLVYVIRDNLIIVTTRKEAMERGEVLPEVFRAK